MSDRIDVTERVGNRLVGRRVAMGRCGSPRRPVGHRRKRSSLEQADSCLAEDSVPAQDLVTSDQTSANRSTSSPTAAASSSLLAREPATPSRHIAVELPANSIVCRAGKRRWSSWPIGVRALANPSWLLLPERGPNAPQTNSARDELDGNAAEPRTRGVKAMSPMFDSSSPPAARL